MREFLKIFVFSILVTITLGSSNYTDFISKNVLPDGEIEVRIRYQGISAKETTVSSRSSTNIILRQVTDGKHFIQLIYDDLDNIKDCEYVHEKSQVRTFLRKFQNDLDSILATSNVTVEILDNNRKLPKDIRKWLNYDKLRRKCRKTHRAIRKLMKEMKKHKREEKEKERDDNSTNKRSRKIRSLSDYLIVPGTYWCGQGNIANSYTHLGGMSLTDKCCRKHDHCKNNIHGLTKKYNYYNVKPFTISHCWCDNRSKRGIGEMFQAPGTEWCGKGYSAKKYTHLGGFHRTDKCCRVHDTACPFWIGGFDTKYGLFNWRVNTLMHCSCDDRFRACLKMAGTSDANLVGKVFFNVVQTKCFVLKPKKVCAKRSWWGKCTKMKYVKHAIIRDNLSY